MRLSPNERNAKVATVDTKQEWFPRFTKTYDGPHERRNPVTNRKLVPCQSIGFHLHGDDWDPYWNALTEGQKQALRDKAKWEHMSLSLVAIEWGSD
jgi:hypothetical protein